MRNHGLVSENGHRKQRRRNAKLDFWKSLYWMHPNTPHGALLIFHLYLSKRATPECELETCICIWHVSSSSILPRGYFKKYQYLVLFLFYKFNDMHMTWWCKWENIVDGKRFFAFLFLLLFNKILVRTKN